MDQLLLLFVHNGASSAVTGAPVRCQINASALNIGSEGKTNSSSDGTNKTVYSMPLLKSSDGAIYVKVFAEISP